MPLLPDVTISSLSGDTPEKKIDSLVSQINEAFHLISNESRTQVVNDDSGTPRLLEGYQKGGFTNGDVGVKLSQDGKDVLTATSDELIFSSDFNTFKIIDVVEGTFPIVTTTLSGGASSNLELTVIPHDLGYTPAFVAYAGSGGTYFSVPYITNSAVSSTGIIVGYNTIQITDENIYLRSQIVGYGSGGSVGLSALPVKIYLLRETAS